jgi:biotin operon repressor
MDFGYPKSMEVKLSKNKFLFPEVKDLINSENYKFYQLFLLIFSKDHSKSNDMLSESLKTKYKEILEMIKRIQKEGNDVTDLPTYYELIGEN